MDEHINLNGAPHILCTISVDEISEIIIRVAHTSSTNAERAAREIIGRFLRR